MLSISIDQAELSSEQLSTLEELWKNSVSDILHCTSLAACGHPGGSMSSLHCLLALYALCGVEQHKVFVSHGHISPGVYSALANLGFFDREEMVVHFRRTGSKYAGHVETGVPGVHWNTGNLGQGLSAACGNALAEKIKQSDNKTFVLMGDGEQQKGQLSEARRSALKFGLNNLIAVIDYNRYQIGGDISDVMPQDIAGNYQSDGWNVLELKEGHNFQDVFKVIRKAWLGQVKDPQKPTVIIAHTTMGYGVPFMHNDCEFHGRALNNDELDKACAELGIDNRLSELKEKRAKLDAFSCQEEAFQAPTLDIQAGQNILYGPDVFTDNRSAYGSALADLAKHNTQSTHKLAAVSCDLAGSVKFSAFAKISPESFFECGIQEHHSAVMAGALSKYGYAVFFSTFGTFGVDEVYNQQRLNAFNHTNLKTVCTHLGLSVGEDGPTHQSLDYIGLLRNIFGQQIFIPADPNQTDRIIRYVATHYGNMFVGMGRAKTPVILNEQGQPFFGTDYVFTPGKADMLRKGTDATILVHGALVDYAVQAADQLKESGQANVRVLNMASIEPVDRQAIITAAKETKAMISLEDHHQATGLGAIAGNVLAEEAISMPFERLGVEQFSYSGNPAELYAAHGLDVESIKSRLLKLL